MHWGNHQSGALALLVGSFGVARDLPLCSSGHPPAAPLTRSGSQRLRPAAQFSIHPTTGKEHMATVRYLVNDVDESLPFYRALGFKLADRWGPPFAVVKGNGFTLWLSGPGTSARKRLPSGAVPQSGGWNRLVIQVRNIEQALAKLESTGARFRSKPIKGPGGRQVLVEDPSGNPIELFEPKATEEGQA
jgi:catechol 2,3-dioxygenase-like lactoylglutathione lyase family enzyme